MEVYNLAYSIAVTTGLTHMVKGLQNEPAHAAGFRPLAAIRYYGDLAGAWAMIALGAALLLTGCGLFVLAAFAWLKTGESHVASAWDFVLSVIGRSALYGWLTKPADWLGLHRVVVWLLEWPVAVYSVVIGVALVAGGWRQIEEIRRPRSDRLE